MDNISKKLDALIDALGFDVEVEYVPLDDCAVSDWNNKWRNANTSHIPPKPTATNNYKLTSRDVTVPIKVQSKEWGCIVDFVMSHREDIINDINDYGGLGFILDFMEGNK